ncbi:MAG TPA: EMC3/TMCO1 family protein [Methanocorpusculum sp.]|nr:EMC3/TMCO1 family protein [Methanocorpusculum sp.]
MKFSEFGKKYGMFIALAAMVGIMLLYQWEWARQTIAGLVDIIIGPFVAMGLPFFALLLILATITGFYSSLTQKYTIDYEKMAEVQDKLKDFNVKFREAQMSGDERLIKKMQARQQAILNEQMQMTQQQFTPMIYIMIVTIPIFFWIYEKIRAMPMSGEVTAAIADLSNSIVIPFAGLSSYFDVYLWIFPLWLLWYLLCSLCMTQIIRKALNIGGM